MTNKQTIDGVPRALLGNIEMTWRQAPVFSNKANDIIAAGLGELRALLDKPELMCKGAMSLSTGCGECSRCMDELRLAAQHQAGQDRAVSLAMTREMRIYIAGPMTGLPEFNFPAFNAMAEEMREAGWHVENPAEHGHVDGAEWADYLRYDIGRLATCEAIMLLPGWSKSRGARLEVSIAKELGMPPMLPKVRSMSQPPSPKASRSLMQTRSHLKTSQRLHTLAASMLMNGCGRRASQEWWRCTPSSPKARLSGLKSGAKPIRVLLRPAWRK